LARTETYRAPEFDLPGGLVTPAADIWSLGCVFLEYITWYLLGTEAVEVKFCQARLEKGSTMWETNPLFKIEKGENDRDRAILKPGVIQWIHELKENKACSWFLVQMLDLIEHQMLALDAASRTRTTVISKIINDLYLENERLSRQFEKHDTRMKRSHASAPCSSVVDLNRGSHSSIPLTFHMPPGTTRHSQKQLLTTDQVKSDSSQNESSREFLVPLSLLYIHTHAFAQ
jgi:serine/threonine protein kinase